MHAARWGHLACAKFLLERDAEVNARDGDGRTALSQTVGKDVGLGLAPGERYLGNRKGPQSPQRKRMEYQGFLKSRKSAGIVPRRYLTLSVSQREMELWGRSR